MLLLLAQTQTQKIWEYIQYILKMLSHMSHRPAEGKQCGSGNNINTHLILSDNVLCDCKCNNVTKITSVRHFMASLQVKVIHYWKVLP